MTMFTWKRQIRTYKVAEEWGTNSLLMFWLGVGKIIDNLHFFNWMDRRFNEF